MNFPQKIAGLALLSSLSLTAIATPASALTFTKLLELGQKVPGDDQSVTEIVEPTIGLDGQIAVLLKTKEVKTPTRTNKFSGIYTIPKGGALKLVEGAITTAPAPGTVGSSDANEFTAPSISSGKIAYLRSRTAYKPSEAIPSRSTLLRVGSPGNVKTVLTLPPMMVVSYDLSRGPTPAIVNGKVYFLSLPSDPNSNLPNTLNLVDTQVASPQIQTLRTDIYGLPAASANTLLIANRTASSIELFESTGDANFKPVLGVSNCVGASVSHESIAAICSDSQGTVLKVRFGRQGAFFTVSDAISGLQIKYGLRRLKNPSISDRSVLFNRYPNTRVPVDTGIYLSKNGQAPIRLLRGGNINGPGELLDGKKVSSADLSEHGRSLAGNSAVCVVTFSDRSQALYRIDL